MKLFNKIFGKREKQGKQYSQEELEEITDFIEKNYGAVDLVGHEVESGDIHIDLAVIFPHDGANYYTICTMGRGAHKLEGLGGIKARQEFVLFLPAYWNVANESGNKEENWWPIRLLKSVSRIDEYYGPFEILDLEKNYNDFTKTSALFFTPSLTDFCGSTEVRLASGKRVEFLQMIPIDANDVEKWDNNETSIERAAQILNISQKELEDGTVSRDVLISRVLAHFEQLNLENK
ncbi:MAG: suppressor of fused domain protein [Bacteroidaceae bacterium]|nr:suppressor of fused domain protein [Bacteroidaceae bacterium]